MAVGREETGGIQVIARAAAILRALEEQPEGLGFPELAARVGLARSTVQRIVGALAAEQLLLVGAPRGRVKLGPALVRLASVTDVGTDRLVRPILQRLSRDLEETVDLSILQGASAIFVDQIVGTNRLVAMSAVGEAFPVYCTANGKALLACISAERRATLLDRRLDRLTPATITDAALIEGEIADFFKTQIAWDIEEHAEGICAAGTSFIDPLGRDFAISIPAPSARFAAKRERIAERLRAAQDEAIAAIAGSRRPAG
jgi:DNA-binding IclR family transcriptional regulator